VEEFRPIGQWRMKSIDPARTDETVIDFFDETVIGYGSKDRYFRQRKVGVDTIETGRGFWEFDHKSNVPTLYYVIAPAPSSAGVRYYITYIQDGGFRAIRIDDGEEYSLSRKLNIPSNDIF
jgi:hypothetical protein